MGARCPTGGLTRCPLHQTPAAHLGLDILRVLSRSRRKVIWRAYIRFYRSITMVLREPGIEGVQTSVHPGTAVGCRSPRPAGAERGDKSLELWEHHFPLDIYRSYYIYRSYSVLCLVKNGEWNMINRKHTDTGTDGKVKSDMLQY